MSKKANIICLIILFIAICSIGAGCEYAVYFPQEGEWYCEELNLQLAFEKGKDAYIVINEEEIRCDCIIDRGTDWVMVLCQERNNQNYKIGDGVFDGQFRSLNDTELVVYSPDHNRTFTFVKRTDVAD